ncbi:ArnT family glycosyltransferase [Candidatus Promineifilum breve]|nr:phospholipid carrier-dependent glycosyltransferase [Candidatus Promineifilum breve]
MTSRTKALYWVILVALAFFAGFIVFNTTAIYGIGLSQDSVVYMAAAQNIATGEGIKSLDGTPITMWPPLYPSILAFFVWLLSADVLVVARYLNIVLAVVTVLLTYLLARQLRISPMPALGAAAISAWAYSIVEPRLMAWSEPLFIVLILLSIISLNRYITHGNVYSLGLFVISAALAAITRYIGVIIIPVGVLVILVFSRSRWHIRLVHALSLLLITSLPLTLFFIRNWLTSQSLMGARHPPTITLIQNIEATARVITGWFMPSSLSDNGFVVLAFVLLFQLIAAAVVLEYRRGQGTKETVFRLYFPTFFFIVFYVTFLLYSTTTTNLNEIDNRYLIPIFVPLMMLVFGSASIVFEAAKSHFSKSVLSVAFAAVLLLLLSWPLRATLLSVQYWRNTGEGFSAAVWDTNETLNYLKSNPSLLTDQVVYSNYPDVIFAHLRHESQFIPYHYYAGSTQVLRDVDQLKGEWPSGEGLIVWFNWGEWQTHLFRPEELLPISQMSKIVTTADGTIWRVAPLDNP